jgi:hypothetical protein
LITHDNGVTIIFEHEYVPGPNKHRSMVAKLEYVEWIEEILKLNYKVLNLILLCNWVKTNCIESNATIKIYEYGFTLVNFWSLIPIYD